MDFESSAGIWLKYGSKIQHVHLSSQRCVQAFWNSLYLAQRRCALNLEFGTQLKFRTFTSNNPIPVNVYVNFLHCLSINNFLKYHKFPRIKKKLNFSTSCGSKWNSHIQYETLRFIWHMISSYICNTFHVFFFNFTDSLHSI